MGGSGKVSRGGVAGVCRVPLRHTSPCKEKARGVARRAQTGWGGRAGMSAHVAGARPVVFCGEHPARRDCEQHPETTRLFVALFVAEETPWKHHLR